MVTQLNAPPQHDSSLTCNAEESDSRIWLRLNSAGDKKPVLSPDTDVYNIGLPLISETNLDTEVSSLFKGSTSSPYESPNQ